MFTGIRRLFLTFLFCAAFAFGQLDSNSITVTASRNVRLQPDQALFGVFVDSGASTSLDQIVAALQGTGITMANFSSVSTPIGTQGIVSPNMQAVPAVLEWAFALPVPLSKITATIKTLTALQQTIVENSSGLTLSFTVAGTQVSQQLQQSQTCVLADLISDAQGQANKIAAAAGVAVGNILALSSPVVTSVANGAIPISRFTSVIASQLTSPPACSATVKFALVRF